MKYLAAVIVTILIVGGGWLVLRSEEPERAINEEEPITQTERIEDPDPAPQLTLDTRQGEPPSVTDGIPHIQLDQTSPDDVYDSLLEQTYQLENIVGGDSQSSLPGAQSISAPAGLELNPRSIIMNREFAHIHADPGRGSLHMVLRESHAAYAIEQGWGVWHPFALDGRIPGMIMAFAPRDETEIPTILTLIEASRDNALVQ